MLLKRSIFNGRTYLTFYLLTFFFKHASAFNSFLVMS